MSSLPPDPWKVLGLEKSADKSEIRTAYRKLVLKCHPDKVQDPTLKAQKQDEFQRVQQAYELLNDDGERAKYEEQLKMAEIRAKAAAMHSKNIPNTSASRTPPRSSTQHAYFDVRTVEPHETRFRHASPHHSSPANPKVTVYTQYSSKTKSYEDEMSSRSQELYDEEVRRARRAASYDQPSSRRDDDKREERKRREARERKEEDERDRERERERREKELRKQDRRERDKVRDKEKRRDVEDKASFRRANKSAYVEEYDREEVYPPKVEKKKVSSSLSSSKKAAVADEIPLREKSSSRREREESPRLRTEHKHDLWKESAAAYIERHRTKSKGTAPSLGRAQTFQEAPTYARVPSPPPAAEYIDDDAPRRSSARPSRRSSHDMDVRSKEKLYSSSQKKSQEDIEVIDNTSSRAERAGPPRAAERIPPSFQKMSSAPPLASMVSPAGPESPPRRPMRTNTVQEPYSARPPAAPKLPRSQTFGGEKTDRYRPMHVLVGEVTEVVSDDERDAYERPRRHRSRRTHSPEPATTTRRYKHGGGGVVTPIGETVYEPELYDHHDDYRSSSRRHNSSYGPKVETSRREGNGADYYYDHPAASPFKVKTSKSYTPEDVAYTDLRYPPSQGHWSGVATA